MNGRTTITTNVICFILGIGVCLTAQLFTGWGQDVPGTGGLTRYQLAGMLYECDRDSGNKPEGYCIADINVRPSEAQK